MFEWLRNLITQPWSKEAPPSLDNHYHPRERMIYSYWDGQKTVHADPMVLYKRMMTHGAELSVDMKVSQSASKDAGKAHDSMVQKVREIFVVKTLEEGGLAELEVLELLDHFLLYCEDVKKNSNLSPISPTPTPPPTAPSSAGPSATASSSDSGSTANVSNTAVPAPLPSERVSPSV